MCPPSEGLRAGTRGPPPISFLTSAYRALVFLMLLVFSDPNNTSPWFALLGSSDPYFPRQTEMDLSSGSRGSSAPFRPPLSCCSGPLGDAGTLCRGVAASMLSGGLRLCPRARGPAWGGGDELFLYSLSGEPIEGLGTGCCAEYKESNLHILRSRIVRKKICT